MADRSERKDYTQELVVSGALDRGFDSIDSGELQLTGEGGFIPSMIKAVLERALQAELSSHLGYEKNEAAGRGSGNSRNATSPKTLITEAGLVSLGVPRDRNGVFAPRLVPKGMRRTGGLDDMIISLYAGGMTVREIGHHLEATFDTQISHETISNITDQVLDEVRVWQDRPLDAFYPVMYLDAISVKIKDGGKVVNKAVHIALGVDMDGIKHVLGTWVQPEEGAAFWAGVCANLANRGVRDVLVVATDGLSGFPEAVEATWPNAIIQTCVVHLIRASMRFVAYKDRKVVARGLRSIYTAPSEEAALEALEAFAESDLGRKYPPTVTTWQRAWERFIPFLDLAPMVRRVIYTTNAIESFNYQLRKISKNRGHFPNEEAAVKLLWLAIINIEEKRAREREKEKGRKRGENRKAKGYLMEGQMTTNWKQALTQLAAAFPDRMEPHL
ncbi:IS256 family transposase [uncultured Mobiluncus sp.]|uniref:IS256 family transposase n=1 Tax=uncultured Mobiluncus sp. TaxID=293425 RepID=UPI00262EC1C3|nr:IS256 family transposase [uncultured Mobiluncus sp.]